MKKVLSFIDSNFSTDLTVDRIAREVCLSPSHLSHMIKKECNLTLGMCIARARIEKSKKLLRDTDLSISSVAQEVGYPDQSYFTKVFKKLESVTPAEFKREALNRNFHSILRSR
jgi:YesN/AraC family two-component response regulator